jgi:transcriptional regulator with XRE-family HTH domain
MSQTEMAKALGLQVHYSAVSNYELGTREPDLLTVLKYAELAGVSTDVLIDYKQKAGAMSDRDFVHSNLVGTPN